MKNKAKKIIYFKNYVPVDKELGMKSHDPVVDIEQEQKRIDLKIKKSVQKCLSDAKVQKPDKNADFFSTQ